MARVRARTRARCAAVRSAERRALHGDDTRARPCKPAPPSRGEPGRSEATAGLELLGVHEGKRGDARRPPADRGRHRGSRERPSRYRVCHRARTGPDQSLAHLRRRGSQHRGRHVAERPWSLSNELPKIVQGRGTTGKRARRRVLRRAREKARSRFPSRRPVSLSAEPSLTTAGGCRRPPSREDGKGPCRIARFRRTRQPRASRKRASRPELLKRGEQRRQPTRQPVGEEEQLETREDQERTKR